MSKNKKNEKRIFQSEALDSLRENSKDGLFKELLSDWKWIFRYVKKHIRLVIVYLISGIAASSFTLLNSYAIKMLINDIVAKEYQNIVILGVVLVSSVVLTLVFRALAMRVAAKVSIKVNNDIQAEIFDKILAAKWSDFNEYQTGDIINRFNDDVKTISENAVSWIPDMLINLYTFVLTFVVLWRIDYIMAIISIMAAPVLLVASRILISALHSSRKKVAKLNSEMISFETDTLNNYEMIKSFGIRDFYNRQMSLWHGKYQKSNLDYNGVEIKAHITMQFTSALITLIALAYCFVRLSTGTLLYGDMTFFLSQRTNVSNRFNSLVTAVPGLLKSAVSAHRICELTTLESENENIFDIDATDFAEGVAVEIDNIGFSYNENVHVYDGGSFVANPGEIVSIIGASGEGKTTLLRLILGLVSPNSGSIMLRFRDGTLKPITTDVRKYISYVPQGCSTIPGTIADNMRMVKETATDDEIIAALKTACAWDFIESLPDGINTHLGSNSHGISTGQAQRISIARALLRDAPILILDEATGALDTETEKKVLENIVSACPNKTCIVSTHRMSILEQSKRVYKIEDKRIVEV